MIVSAVNPNLFAYLVLFAYPLFAVVLFRRLELHKALIWTILLGYLFLPEKTEVDLPMVPPFDKVLIPSLAATVMVWWTLVHQKRAERLRMSRQNKVTESVSSAGSRRKRPQPRRRGTLVTNVLLALFVLSPLLYYAGNQNPVYNGARILRGVGLYDAISLTVAGLIMIMPFLLARRHLATAEAQNYLLFALVSGGLVYSFLMLFEVRMSPQLHTWLYGFFPHSILQHRRGGGFRPIVFLEHGLRVGIFVAMAVLAAIALWRARKGKRPGHWLGAGLWLFAVLIFSRNFGAPLLVILFAPALILFGLRIQLFIAAAASTIVLLYPMLRGAGLVPTEMIVTAAAEIDASRAGSLAFRFVNEDALLERANEKPLFGWGGFGRAFVFDDRFGTNTAVPDGIWVIIMGEQGWVGYIATFGLVCMPLILIAWRRKILQPDWVTAGLAIVLAINLIDMLPNSSLVSVTWLIAGALMGRYEQGRSGVPTAAPLAQPAETPSPHCRPAYARQSLRSSR